MQRLLRHMAIAGVVLAIAAIVLLLYGATLADGRVFASTVTARWIAASVFIVASAGAALVYGLYCAARRTQPRKHTGSLLDRTLTAIKSWVLPALRSLYVRLPKNAIIHAASQEPTDVVHCHDLWALPIGAIVKRRLGARLVWDAHEIYEEIAQGNASHAEVCRTLLRRHQPDVDYFITINESIAEFYKTHYPSLPPARIVKNAAPYTPLVSYDGRMHEACGMPRTQKIALYQGGFSEKRGLRDLVHAARHLNDDWTLVMMGWGTLEAELKAIGAEINTARPDRTVPAISFLPAAKQSELVYWTAGGTIGLIPYENVGLNHLFCTPNKLWEYPAAGVPILCSPLVEMTKTVLTHGTGWLLPESTDPHSIAAAINNLTPEMIETASQACLTFIQNDNWKTYGDRVIDLYEEINVTLQASRRQ